MNPLYGQLGLLVLVAGMFVTALGFLFFTEILSGPGTLLYMGAIMIVGGAVACHLDFRSSEEIIDAYNCRRMLDKAPDDDYGIDLTSDLGKKWDAPEITDMTGGEDGQ